MAEGGKVKWAFRMVMNSNFNKIFSNIKLEMLENNCVKCFEVEMVEKQKKIRI